MGKTPATTEPATKVTKAKPTKTESTTVKSADPEPPIVALPPAPVGPANASSWILIVGACFGAITLAGFMVFAYLSATDPNFCKAYTLLAPVFALGTGLATAFLGGAAVVNGNLTIVGLKSPVALGLGGGVAVTLISFVLFNNYSPTCDPAPSQLLSINRVPSAFTSYPEAKLWNNPDAALWTKRQYTQRKDKYRYDVLVGNQIGEVIVIASNEEKKIDCELPFELTDNISDAIKRAQNFSYPEPGILADLNVEFLSTIPDQDKEGELQCFSQRDRGISVKLSGPILVSFAEKKFAIGTPKPTQVLSQLQTPAIRQKQATGILQVGSAFAQEPVLPFDEIVDLLRTSDSNTRVTARQYITKNFNSYSGELVSEIGNNRANDNGTFIADLLSAFIDGVSFRFPEFGPGQGVTPGKERDFSREIPYITGSENMFVAFTANADPRVKKQARRLVQRYPFDGFKKIYDQLIDELPIACTLNEVNEETQAKLYSAVFFYYNRIVDHNYAPTLTPDAISDANANAAKGLRAAQCLRPDLQVDGAVIFYGLALINSQDSGTPRDVEAKKQAKNFLDFIKGRSDRYFLPTHIDEMKKLAGL